MDFQSKHEKHTHIIRGLIEKWRGKVDNGDSFTMNSVEVSFAKYIYDQDSVRNSMELPKEDLGLWELAIGVYLKGINDSKESVKYLKKAAEKNNPGALFLLAQYHYTGEGVKKNEILSFECLTRSANLGFKLAVQEILQHYAHGSIPSIWLDQIENFEQFIPEEPQFGHDKEVFLNPSKTGRAFQQ